MIKLKINFELKLTLVLISELVLYLSLLTLQTHCPLTPYEIKPISKSESKKADLKLSNFDDD